MTVRLELSDKLTGARRGELPRSRVTTLERRLDGPGTVELEVPYDEVLAPTRDDLGAVELTVYVDGVPWWQGPLWTVRGSSSGSLNYSGAGVESYLGQRHLEADLSYAGVDQATILANLLAHTQGQTDGGLRISDSGVTLSGVTRTRDYYVDERPHIGELMDAFRNLSDGLDWSIEVLSDATRALTTYYPERGTARPELPLELGGAIVEFEWTVDGATVNDVVARGQTQGGGAEGPDRPEGRYTDAALRASRGLSTAVVDAGNTTEASSLVERARAEVEHRGNPLELVSITVRDTADVDVTALELGDTHRVRIDRGPIAVDRDLRIVSIDLDPYTRQAKLGVNPP